MVISGIFVPTAGQVFSTQFMLKASPVPPVGGAAVNDLPAAGPVPSAAPLAAVRPFPATSLFADLLGRLQRSRAWVGAQFWAIFCFILAGIAWASAPSEPAWQASLFSLAPPLLAAAMLILQAITMRSLMGEDPKRAPFLWGTLALLGWAAVIVAVWALLVWCDRALPLWVAWLSAHAQPQATMLTAWRAEGWFEAGAWVLRWIVVPAAAVPCAMAAAQWGGDLPWRKIGRMLLGWRWWTGVVLAALVGVALPDGLFAAAPDGSIPHQIIALFLRLGVAFVLAVGSWVLLLGWAAVLLGRKSPPPLRLVARQPKPQIPLHTKAA